MSSSMEKKIILRSCDGEAFEVDEVVALKSEVLRHVIEDVCVDDSGILIPNVKGNILRKVIKYCKKHATTDYEGYSFDAEFELYLWEQKFIMKLDDAMLLDLIVAADYLDIKGLFNLTCRAVAYKIKCNNPKQTRSRFNIKNDYTPEEEEEVRRENEWPFG